MKRTPYLILICLFMLKPLSASAAPVGNIGDEALWNMGILQNSNDISFIANISIDNQVNKLPEQIKRFAWTDPTSAPPEQRFYPQTRKSKNTIDTYGTQIGMPVNENAIVYALLGMSNSSVWLHYEDWTVYPNGRTFASENTFNSGPDLYYGLGSTIIMQRTEIAKNVPLTIGMDFKYRRFSINDDELRSNGTSYSASLNEFQLAILLSTKLDFCSPYIGVKIASMTGNETYIDNKYTTHYFPEGYIHYSNDITWSKNIGYFIGTTKYFKDMFSVGVELRGGDETGIGINATTRF